MAGKESVVRPSELPMTFQVKYMGYTPARGLWGIKHTRKPVDNLVNAAKHMSPGKYIPRVKVIVSKSGIHMISFKSKMSQSKDEAETDGAEDIFPIETISYGVQDLVYTRVFSMIIVKEMNPKMVNDPFECHAFVCDSRAEARRLTYALAAAFNDYSARVTEQEQRGEKVQRKKFAIDLRTPEELADAEQEETDA